MSEEVGSEKINGVKKARRKRKGVGRGGGVEGEHETKRRVINRKDEGCVEERNEGSVKRTRQAKTRQKMESRERSGEREGARHGNRTKEEGERE